MFKVADAMGGGATEEPSQEESAQESVVLELI